MSKILDAIRTCFIIFFLGHNRTGKSVMALAMAKAYRKKWGKKKRIVSYDPQNRFKDISDEFIYEQDWGKYFGEDGKPNISDTLFILDDYRGLMPRDTLDENFLRLLMQRNEYGLDFIFVIHSPKLIIERISYYITHFALFYTAGDEDGFKTAKKMPSVSDVAQCSQLVNKYVKEHGRGEYKNLSFPFAFIDTEEETIKLINMDKAEVSGNSVSYPDSKVKEEVTTQG